LPAFLRKPLRKQVLQVSSAFRRFAIFVFLSGPTPAFLGPGVSRRVQLATLSLVALFAFADLGYHIAHARTSAPKTSYADRTAGCASCAQDEWEARVRRDVAEGGYAYVRHPVCRTPRSLGGESWRILKMAALAPTKLFFGTLFEVLDLEISNAFVGNTVHGNRIGRWLAQDGTAVAEYADFFVAFPTGSKIDERATEVRLLGSDGTVHGACATDARDVECRGDLSYARLEYAPTQTKGTAFECIKVRFVNWLHEDGFGAHPRTIELIVRFTPPTRQTPKALKAIAYKADERHCGEGMQPEEVAAKGA